MDGKTLELGKVDYNGSGRRNCMADLEWELKNGKFSMRTTCTQVANIVVAYFPNNERAQRMMEIWKRWHLWEYMEHLPLRYLLWWAMRG